MMDGRVYGYAADHVHAIEVVTADGKLHRVTADSEPPLFWALRGGKGNFGVVTALEFILFPVKSFYGGGLYFAGERSMALRDFPSEAAEAMLAVLGPGWFWCTVGFVELRPLGGALEHPSRCAERGTWSERALVALRRRWRPARPGPCLETFSAPSRAPVPRNCASSTVQSATTTSPRSRSSTTHATCSV